VVGGEEFESIKCKTKVTIETRKANGNFKLQNATKKMAKERFSQRICDIKAKLVRKFKDKEKNREGSE